MEELRQARIMYRNRLLVEIGLMAGFVILTIVIWVLYWDNPGWLQAGMLVALILAAGGLIFNAVDFVQLTNTMQAQNAVTMEATPKTRSAAVTVARKAARKPAAKPKRRTRKGR